MSSDPGARHVMAPASHPGNFMFASQQQSQPQPQSQPRYQQQQREIKKNFVFVDEHNRHKRLKVMRACEGCRRRKIKCDAATTNTWPCSACIRLKLSCVRPNGFDENDTTIYEPVKQEFSPAAAFYDGFSLPPPASGPHQPPPTLADAPKSIPALYTTQTGFIDAFPSPTYPDRPHSHHDLHYTTIPPPPVSIPPTLPLLNQQQYPAQNVFPTPPLQQGLVEGLSPDSSSSQQELTDILGSLNVNEAGTAPYLRNKASFLREEPAVEDDEDFDVPVMPVRRGGSGSKIRIPPELMPDESTALHYFDLFFAHAHPYIPVLSRTLFYQQWTAARNTISPLILEAIFAISGRLAEEPAQGQQWLALASSHADAFMDVPRLSTLQALLLLLKAREAAPKRGYYYRSWMSVVQCVQMAKDLGLDEHFSDHVESGGGFCDSSPLECQMKTRIWQVIFACETMTGAPQGRTDLSVSLDSVDFGIPSTPVVPDDPDFVVSRSFAYFVRIVRNASKMNNLYARIKKKKDWGVHPEWAQLDPLFDAFLSELPAQLAVSFPEDGVTAPWLPSPFPGNLLSYHYLTLILLHRAQLSSLDPVADAARWKTHMVICYESAKAICRLQEGIINSHGLAGLQCMLRGFSFTIYAALSCIVLHLVSMTSPDPVLNTDSSEYFTRHMRIIEAVMAVWTMPELQRQVDAVREAFSADTSRPFVLRQNFPFGSPRPSHHSASPPPRHTAITATTFTTPAIADAARQCKSLDQQLRADTYSTQQPISPPMSVAPGDKCDSPSVRSFMLMPQRSSQGAPLLQQQNMAIAEDQSGWNPTRIFKQWTSTFGPQPDPSPPQIPPHQQGTRMGFGSPGATSPTSDPSAPHHSLQSTVDLSPSGAPQMSPQQFAVAQMAFVTPAMWQEHVQSVYASGMKRTWGEFDAGSSGASS